MQLPGMEGAVHLVPSSFLYMSATQQAANTNPPLPSNNKPGPPRVAIMEVTVLQFGGLTDTQQETAIRACLADAITHKVRTAVEKAVHRPICIIAGWWSVSSKSRGNFIYTLASEVPFTTIQSYESLLVAPFPGPSQLCPSLGWVRLLAHGVPTIDNSVRGPDSLLKEVRSLPGLRSMYFTLPPRWVRPVERLKGHYSSISFAFSDPDSTISSKLLNRRHGLFGKEVCIERWLDKPLLIQCSCCHTLGHTSSSCQCTVPKGDSRCAKCGGTHTTETHTRHCKGRHVVARTCNCKLPCLSCRSKDHDCRSHKCPAWDNFQTCHHRPMDKGKGRANTGPEILEDNQAGELLLEACLEEELAVNTPQSPPPRAQTPILAPTSSRLWAQQSHTPPQSPRDLPWPLAMDKWPQYLISSVNMQKRNVVTHALLNFVSHTHLILL